MKHATLPISPTQFAPSKAVTRTHCPFCAFQCGITIESRDGAYLVAGDPTFPVNNGQLCIKGFNAGELLTRRDRITSPLKRTSNGGFESILWETALNEIAARWTSIRERHGANANACYGSGSLTNEKAYLLGKFARLALRTANIDYNGRYCMSSAAAAQNKAFGIDRGMPFPIADLPGASAVLLWGSNLADTLPPAMQYFDALRSAGGKLIVVDPRKTDTARAAAIHLQLTPGSDLALANGLLHLAVEEQLVDLDYIVRRTSGFDAVRATVSQYVPAIVERITGIAEPMMRKVVRLMADGRTMLLSGRGPEQQSKGVDSVLAMINLMLALGKCGMPNSGYGTLTGQGNGQGGREHGQKCDQLPGYRSIENELHRREIAAIWQVDAAQIPRKGLPTVQLLNALGSEVKSLLVMGSNLAVASADSTNVTEKLKSLEMLVVCDSFMNETAALADYILPTMQWAEEEGTLTNFEGRVLRRRVAAAAPPGVLSDLTILGELAKRLGASGFDFDGPADVFNELRRCTAGAIADYSSIDYLSIDDANGIPWPCNVDAPKGTPRMFLERFAHPDGKALFHAVEHRDAGEMPDEEYPLYFTTGRLKQHYNSGAQTRRISALEKAQPIPRLQIHPRLAQRLDLSIDARVIVQSRRGEVEFAVEVTSDMREDTVFAPFHWGGKSAANTLTNPSTDPTSDMPEFKLCAVRMKPDIIMNEPGVAKHA